VPWYRKRDGQTYLQTWHGTPLKTLGFDLTTLTEHRAHAWQEIIADVAQWDILISPNPYTTKIMRRAYRYEGEILKTGYPRNDLLQAPDAEERRAAIRAGLGIAPDMRVVLYAPTWRDDLIIGSRHRRAYQLALDVKKAQAALGSDHVLLLRAHHYMATDRAWRRDDGFVVDVSDYPDIADLYLATDVLVTDYSSAMFDFAVTGKPMVFFTYDLERYRDDVHASISTWRPRPQGQCSARPTKLSTPCAPKPTTSMRTPMRPSLRPIALMTTASPRPGS
jgi:CDP-glycerol glycerophosphotransferase